MLLVYRLQVASQVRSDYPFDGRQRSDGCVFLLCPQRLTDELRLSYCRLWWALIRGDQSDIQRHCLALNAGELYPLMACMVTARAWENIQTGISESQRSRAEVGAGRQGLVPSPGIRGGARLSGSHSQSWY